MTWMRYGQAAMVAAIVVLTGNTVWAQSTVAGGTILPSTTGCCKKEGKCCKDGDCCCDNGKCCSSKSGKCCTKETKDGCCPFLSKLAKRTAIIMVMPSSLPLPVSCCLEAMGMMPHPPVPPLLPGPHVFLPQPTPLPWFEPIHLAPTVAGKPVLSNPPSADKPPFCGEGLCGQLALGDTIVTCSVSKPAAPARLSITATPSSDQVEVSVGEETSIRCKKMKLTIRHKDITVSRLGDRVRVRSDELKATADRVCTDGNDCLILEGDVVMHCHNDGHSIPKVMRGDHIELNLSNGAVKIKRYAKTPSSTAVHYDKNDK